MILINLIVIFFYMVLYKIDVVVFWFICYVYLGIISTFIMGIKYLVVEEGVDELMN